MTTPPVWQLAVEEQIAATVMLRQVVRLVKENPNVGKAFMISGPDLSERVPMDAMLSRVNLPEQICWWWFEEPLPIVTTTAGENLRAISMGWYDNDELKEGHDEGLYVSTWVDRLSDYRSIDDDPQDVVSRLSTKLLTSQAFMWPAGLTLDALQKILHDGYLNQYGKDERFAGVDRFVTAGITIAKTVLAATIWMQQKVLTTNKEHLERHLRKSLVREGGLDLRGGANVVTLRRSEHAAPSGESKNIDWDHRWIVSGHLRNQPCGVGRTDRKLIWIADHVKGPDDKPLVVKPKAYTISR